MKVPWNESSTYGTSLLGAKIRGNESSSYPADLWIIETENWPDHKWN